jgi:CBS domain-containing protein
MYGRLADVLAEKGRHLYTVRKGASVCEAVREMNLKGVGALVVMDGKRPAGIFTERDVLLRIVDADRDPALTRVVEVMSPDPVLTDARTRVEDAMALMTERRFRHLPVTEDGEVVGMVSIGDLMRWVTMHLEDQMQLMTEYITGRRSG